LREKTEYQSKSARSSVSEPSSEKILTWIKKITTTEPTENTAGYMNYLGNQDISEEVSDEDINPLSSVGSVVVIFYS